jgi:pimeloyl-ACP methyl ester carboxylesterase
MTFGRTATAALRGLCLHYRTLGDGEPLLLLHGFFGASSDFIHLFDVGVLARTHRIIAPDLRGHGGTLDPGGTFSMRECARDLWALLDALGIERVRAVGTSLGGNTLLHMATQQPARVEAMVLVSATSHFPAEARAIMAQASEDGHSDQEWRELRAKHLLGDDQIRALWRRANALQDSHDDLDFTPALLGTIRARTLIVSGDRDPFYPVQISVDMYRAIPQSSLWVVPGGGHCPVFGEERAAFERLALRHLAA